MDKHISYITHNWYTTLDGERYEAFTVGQRDVEYIGEAVPHEGRPFYVVHLKDGREIYIYNPNTVIWKPAEGDVPAVASEIDKLPF